LRAALLVLVLRRTTLLVEDLGISREDEIAAARWTGEFLEKIALDFE